MLGFNLGTDKPINILCLGAHSDDIEIGCGGSLLKIFDNYKISEIRWVVFTSNEIRKQEAVNSAESFLKGINNKTINVLGLRDGFLPFHAIEVKEYFESIKQGFVPDLIFTHYRDDRHQDHRLVSDLTWNTWRNHLILEYEIPKYDGDLGKPNFYVNLDEKYIERKNAIILNSFVSQQQKQWFDLATFTSLPRLRGIESVTTFAEAFYARKVIF
jgi:LmbE family N-acetylglucosaminyl deacetylase